MSVLAARRSIGDIMSAEEEPDVALIQPPLVKPVFPKDQDPVFNQYPGAVTSHAALMNDLGHRAQPRPSPAGRDHADGGCEDRRARFPRLGHHAAPGWRIISEVAEQPPVPAQQRASAGWGPSRSWPLRRPPSAACQRYRTIRPPPKRAAVSAAPGSPGAVAVIAPGARPLSGSSGSSAGSAGKVRYGLYAYAAVTPSSSVTWQGVASLAKARPPRPPTTHDEVTPSMLCAPAAPPHGPVTSTRIPPRSVTAVFAVPSVNVTALAGEMIR